MELNVLRTEKKYAFDLRTAGQIKARLSYVMQRDPNCIDGKPYRVRSLYYDSVYDKDYFEKLDGVELRKKIRLRTYGGGTIKLECKQKRGAKQRKRSLLLSHEQAETMLRGDYSFLMAMSSPFAKELYCTMTELVYRPKAIIEYQRYAFVSPTNDIRITFDSDVCALEGSVGLFDDQLPLYPVQAQNILTLEVKYNHFLLDEIQTALAPFSLREQASSKYLVGRFY